MRWDRGEDRRAELLECYGGVTPWQAAKRVGVLDDTDMCDKDVVMSEPAQKVEHRYSDSGTVKSTVDALWNGL